MLLQFPQLGANSAADIKIPQLIHSVPATKTNSVSKRKKSAVKSTSIIKRARTHGIYKGNNKSKARDQNAIIRRYVLNF